MLKNVFIFAGGILAGTFIGARIAKQKYEEIAEQEIEEVRAYYKEREKEVNAVEEPEVEVEEIKEEKEEYTKIIKRGNYMSMEEDKQTNEYDEAYPIDPSEFGKDGHYATETLTYFADGVLVDDVDQVVEDPELMVGRHHIDVFNEFPDATCVYVRNDLYGTDYEILKDDWCWSDFDEKGYAPPLPKDDDKKPHQL